MFNTIVPKILEIIEKYWHRRSTLVIIVLLILFAGLEFFSTIKLEEISWQESAAIVVTIAIVAAFWYSTVRLPKARRGRIGFAVAIVPETREQQERITADFITALRDLLHNSNLSKEFSFLVIPQHVARAIESPEHAGKILHDSNCRFLLYGRTRTRRVQGENVQILDLNGIVSHRPLPTNIQKKLSAEFTELFPKKVLIGVGSESEVFAFEVTANLVNLVSRYIIGYALLLSGDFSYSQELLEQLEVDANSVKSDFPTIVKIRQRTPKLLAEVYLVQARSRYIEWRRSKAPELMDQMKRYLDSLARVAPHRPDLHALTAIWLFVTKRDIADALHEVDMSRQPGDQTWRYNRAFLLAYKGSLKTALVEYKRASKKTLPQPRNLLDIEEFISWVVEKEPDKPELHLCLGMINWLAKGDKQRAILDFEKFLEACPVDSFAEEGALAETYLQTLRATVNKEEAQKPQ